MRGGVGFMGTIKVEEEDDERANFKERGEGLGRGKK